jgi:hypothetical protein
LCIAIPFAFAPHFVCRPQVTHGTEQAERNKRALAEFAENKAEKGRRVKAESRMLTEQIALERAAQAEEMQQHVAELKAEKIGKVDASKRFMFTAKKDKHDEILRTEDKWKRLSKRQTEQYNAHAHDNHDKNDSGKQHMRENKASLVKRNNHSVHEERRIKARARAP